MKTDQRNILTIATGKKVYIEMAENLARSFQFWNKDNSIDFYLVTDHADLVSTDVKDFISIIKVEPGSLGAGFSSKLQLDKLAPAGQTLFIDSDCLIVGPLGELFNRFSGHSVTVVGDYISSGEWFGDIEAICKKYHVPHLPKFNGGIYYLEAGDKAQAVYQTARDIERDYDEIGFVRLRNMPNDEVIMALAMQLHGLSPVKDDGTIMSDPFACQGEYIIDVIKGACRLHNPPYPHPLHHRWYPFEYAEPLIMHFLGHYTNDYPYRREAYRLKKAIANDLNVLSELNAKFRIEYPAKLTVFLKNVFRPLYRNIFGYRKINKSERT